MTRPPRASQPPRPRDILHDDKPYRLLPSLAVYDSVPVGRARTHLPLRNLVRRRTGPLCVRQDVAPARHGRRGASRGRHAGLLRIVRDNLPRAALARTYAGEPNIL